MDVNIYQIKRRYVLKALIVTVTTMRTSYLKEVKDVREQELRRILAATGEELKQLQEHYTLRSFVRCSIPPTDMAIQTMHTEVLVGKPQGRGQLGTTSHKWKENKHVT
jgi:hypothetical protein